MLPTIATVPASTPVRRRVAHPLAVLAGLCVLLVSGLALSGRAGSGPAAGQAASASDAAALQGFDAEVEATMHALNVPGVAIGVIRDGQVVLARGYGLRDIGKPEAVDAATVFAIGSMSKSFTTAVMATQVDEGKLDWNRPVRDYLPNFRLYDPIATELATPRGLVSDRTGLPRHDFIRMSTYVDRAEVVRRLRYMPPSKTFREGYQYNNLMYVTAGYLSGVIAGSTWEDLVRERIFQPLGMTRSNTSVKDSARIDNHAMPHVLKDGKPVVTAFYDYQRFGIGPNGAVNSTVDDVLKYLRMHIDHGRAADGRQVISAAQVDELFKPVTVSGPDTSYALAWERGQRHGATYVAHGGAITGFTSQMIVFPDRKTGIVVLNNLGSRLPSLVAWRLADRLLGQAGGDYLATPAPSAAARAGASSRGDTKLPTRITGTRPTLPLAAYTGDWTHPAFGKVRVDVKNDGLVVHFDAMDLSLRHYHYDTFEVTGWGGLVSFRLDDAGKPGQMLLPLEPEVEDFVFVRPE